MKRKYKGSERGGVLVITIIAMVVLIGMAALTIDIGVLYHASEQAQHTADAAALAGAGKLREGMDPVAATQAAIETAAMNNVLTDPVTLSPSDVKVGAWDASKKRVVNWDPTATAVAVQVTVRRTEGSTDGPVPAFFARVFGRDSMETARTAVAGLNIESRPRNPVNVMIVQDASGSFQNAWTRSVDANIELMGLINSVSVQGDAMGFAAFSAALPQSYLKQVGLWESYKNNPEYNTGIKYTTETNGSPMRTTDRGVPHRNGQVRRMAADLTVFDTNDRTNLPTSLANAAQVMRGGNAWGDTDTAVGLNHAIDSLNASSAPGAEKIIVLVSDGLPHAVAGSQHTTAQRKQNAIAAANRAEADGIRIHTVTLEGTGGVSFSFNEGLIRNGGYALRAANANKLRDMLVSIGTIEVGQARLLQ